jgi:uncharacterized membrane protein YbhN (UPF0104 family)
VKDTSPALVPRPLWRRVPKPVLVVAALAVVFGWLLPQVIDYREVWEALTELDVWEVILLLGLGLGRVPTEALMYRAFLPRLGLSRGSEAYLSSNFAGQLLPPPSASVVQYGYFRGGGYAPSTAGLAALGSFVFPTMGRLLLPLVALVLLVATGQVSGTILLAGGLSLAISAIAGIAGYYFLRSERSARWLGAKAQRPLSWILVKLGRDPIEDGTTKAVELRVNALAVLREGWALGVDRGRSQSLPHLPDPACRAPLRRRFCVGAVRGRRVRRLRGRVLGQGRCSRSPAAVSGSWTRS